MKRKEILYNLFIDPDPKQVEAAKRVGADSVELNTGPYSACKNHDMEKHLFDLRKAASQAKDIGLRVFAGHGLTDNNVQGVASIREVEELNIGHHIISQSIFLGMEQSVKKMLSCINNAVK